MHSFLDADGCVVKTFGTRCSEHDGLFDLVLCNQSRSDQFWSGLTRLSCNRYCVYAGFKRLPNAEDGSDCGKKVEFLE